MVFDDIYGSKYTESHKAENYNACVHVKIIHPHPGIHDEISHAIFSAEGFSKE